MGGRGGGWPSPRPAVHSVHTVHAGAWQTAPSGVVRTSRFPAFRNAGMWNSGMPVSGTSECRNAELRDAGLWHFGMPECGTSKCRFPACVLLHRVLQRVPQRVSTGARGKGGEGTGGRREEPEGAGERVAGSPPRPAAGHAWKPAATQEPERAWPVDANVSHKRPNGRRMRLPYRYGPPPHWADMVSPNLPCETPTVAGVRHGDGGRAWEPAPAREGGAHEMRGHHASAPPGQPRGMVSPVFRESGHGSTRARVVERGHLG